MLGGRYDLGTLGVWMCVLGRRAVIRLGFGGLGILLLGDDVLLFFLLLIQRFYCYIPFTRE